MQAVWTMIRTDGKKVNFEKKESRRQQKYEKLPSMQRVKEWFDARAISAIRRQAVKCSAGNCTAGQNHICLIWLLMQ